MPVHRPPVGKLALASQGASKSLGTIIGKVVHTVLADCARPSQTRAAVATDLHINMGRPYTYSY